MHAPLAASRASGARQERPFAIVVATACWSVGAYLLWRGETGAALFGMAIGTAVLVVGAARPSLLKRPAHLWWQLARRLAWINARLLLTIIFAALLTPVGLVARLAGRDPLRRRWPSARGWMPHPARYRDRRHYERPF